MKMADLLNNAPQCGKHSEYGEQGKSQMKRLIEREKGESLEMIDLSTLSYISPNSLCARQESFFLYSVCLPMPDRLQNVEGEI